MKVFWTIIATMAILTGFLTWSRGGTQREPTLAGGDSLTYAPAEALRPAVEPLPKREVETVAPTPPAAEPRPAEQPRVEPAEPEVVEPPVVEPPAQEQEEIQSQAASRKPQAEQREVREAASGNDDEGDEPIDDGGLSDEELLRILEEMEHAEAAEAKPDAVETVEAPKADPANPDIIPATIVRRDDGSLLVDDRFIIRGRGTADDPYVITWDLLISASETYDPRRGRTQIPERVKMLDGKHVRIAANITFPIVAQGADEMLAMLNQWDGCCLGIPPTPYDAIEVRLNRPATPQQMLLSWATVTGRLKVEPYLAGDWLLGLYMMEEARLTGDM